MVGIRFVVPAAVKRAEASAWRASAFPGCSRDWILAHPDVRDLDSASVVQHLIQIFLEQAKEDFPGTEAETEAMAAYLDAQKSLASFNQRDATEA